MTSPRLHDYIDDQRLGELIAAARLEDLGPGGRDLTSELLIPADAQGHARMRSRQAGVLSGAALFPVIARAYDGRLAVALRHEDGAALGPGDVVAEFRGPLRSLLAMERVALNFATHLSGIATLTAAFVSAVKGTAARILDTRKTIPGLRELAKYAVVCGGGQSHRMGLYDAVLIKDNHLADIPLAELRGRLGQLLGAARAMRPAPQFVMVEVDRLDQLAEVLPAGPDMVLLDNMAPPLLAEAVALRNALRPGVLLEASGGVNLQTVAAIARSGVDRISVGALTHSAPSLDLGLDIA